MAEAIYNRYKLALGQGNEAWGTADYRTLLLTTAGFVATHSSIADLLAGAAVEASDVSYTRQPLAGESAALDGNVAELTATSPIDYGALINETPVAMVIYRHVDGTNANDLLVSYHDSNFGATANGAGYTITIGASGLITIT